MCKVIHGAPCHSWLFRLHCREAWLEVNKAWWLQSPLNGQSSPGCGGHLWGQPGRLSLDFCSGQVLLAGNVPAELQEGGWEQAGRGASSSHGIKAEKAGKGQSRAGLAGILLCRLQLCFMALLSCRCQELPRPDQSSLLLSRSGVLSSLLPSREGELWGSRSSS